jgi:HD-GYP domain-containing protein (c-di-GMP phosphodiesterase class II)
MNDSIFLDISSLRPGLHIHLDLGWMKHPFPLGSFRIASEDQIQTLRGLGLKQVRVFPDRSDGAALQTLAQEGLLPVSAQPRTALPAVPGPDAALAAATVEVVVVEANPELAAQQARRAALSAEHACAAQAERDYADAGRGLRRAFELAHAQPEAAREQCEGQVHGLLDKVLGEQEMALRLVTESAGDRASLHAINVTLLSLLLGKQMVLHDVGKLELPDRVRWLDPYSPQVSTHERQYYEEHAAHGVTLGKRMKLAPGALLVVAQHHELADGSGFPLKLIGDKMSGPAKIVALVNRYDNLCNPGTPAQALTPHEALALMYGQMRARFDAAVFGAFVKMMGVYPPGSVVQLTDERYAMVVSVNSARPLKPRVLVHEACGLREDALSLELESTPGLGIRRSLKPQQLPRAALEFLSPRPRVCYFFERAREHFMSTAEGTL